MNHLGQEAVCWKDMGVSQRIQGNEHLGFQKRKKRNKYLKKWWESAAPGTEVEGGYGSVF